MSRVNASDTKSLELHGRSWRVTIHVPIHLRPILNATRLKKALNTDSKLEAVRRKPAALAELYRRIAEAEETARGSVKSMRVMAARIFDEYGGTSCPGLEDERSDDIKAVLRPVTSMLPMGRDERTGEPVVSVPAAADAIIQQVNSIARGRIRPIDSFEDEFLDRSKNKDRTKDDLRRALKFVEQWCKKRAIEPCFDRLRKPHAVQFFDEIEVILGKTISPVRKRTYLGVLRRYWAYLEARGRLEVNIWMSVQIDEPHRTREEEERAFTDEEIRRLLTSGAPPRLHDPMMIAALTGARLDAIICLKVGDCLGGAIKFKAQKKESGARLVPIHSGLAEVIKRRCAGKAHSDDLFPEWPAPQKVGSRRERSFKTSNHFTDWRRKIGVDDVIPGNRRSRVNFHSFRRWFITTAERAGIPEPTIASLVGHSRAGVTLGIYAEGPTLDAARAEIEKVQLPDLTKGPIPVAQVVSLVTRDAA
jgi:integrase